MDDNGNNNKNNNNNNNDDGFRMPPMPPTFERLATLDRQKVIQDFVGYLNMIYAAVKEMERRSDLASLSDVLGRLKDEFEAYIKAFAVSEPLLPHNPKATPQIQRDTWLYLRGGVAYLYFALERTVQRIWLNPTNEKAADFQSAFEKWMNLYKDHFAGHKSSVKFL